MDKKPRIKIKDLDVDLDELQKKDPEILKKIRGGVDTTIVPISSTCLWRIQQPPPPCYPGYCPQAGGFRR